MSRETLEFYEPTSLTMERKESRVRSSFEVEGKVTSTSGITIRDLPDEMLSNILMCVGTDDLLRTCRLVSHHWKNISTALCRKRFVTLKESWGWNEKEDKRQADDISTLFGMAHLPWSSCRFTCNSFYLMDGGAFLKSFGKEIWDLAYHQQNEDDCRSILLHTPNVRQIDIDFGEGDWTPADSSSSSSCTNELDLRKLKRLKLKCSKDRHVELLKYIVTTGQAKLDYFKTSIDFLNSSSETIALMASLLRDVPVISCGIFFIPSKPDEFNVLLKEFQNLPIAKLKIHLLEFTKEKCVKEYPSINYHQPERFVTIHAKHLKKLKLKDYGFDSVSVPFNFPFLPALRYLRIHLEYNPNGTAFLSLLQDHQLPVLDEVEIKTSDEAENAIGPLPDFRFYFPTNCRFETVTKLSIKSYQPIRSNLSRVFPNLKYLKYRFISDSATLVECFSWTTLEDLNVVIKPANGMDMNVLLSGIPNPDEIYGKSEEEITQERAIHGLPSILQLTRLKNLHIKYYFFFHDGGYEMLRDPGACLALLQLQPLNLTLTSVKLSDECLGKLEAHHLKFTYDP